MLVRVNPVRLLLLSNFSGFSLSLSRVLSEEPVYTFCKALMSRAHKRVCLWWQFEGHLNKRKRKLFVKVYEFIIVKLILIKIISVPNTLSFPFPFHLDSSFTLSGDHTDMT